VSRADHARARIADNPFYVLELAVDCTRSEVEREGQKLLAMLELDIESARSYASPLGTHKRTSELVRNAMAELRDPERRLRHELWARLGVGRFDSDTADEEARATNDRSWTDAMFAMGWRSR
jgi:hypothetical protein